MREDYICTMHLASLWGNKNQMHVVPTFVALYRVLRKVDLECNNHLDLELSTALFGKDIKFQIPQYGIQDPSNMCPPF